MKCYWTTKDGTSIDVDDMSINHLRNVLKMILRNIESAKSKPKPLGNIESRFLEDQVQDEYEHQYDEWEEYEMGFHGTEIDIY